MEFDHHCQPEIYRGGQQPQREREGDNHSDSEFFLVSKKGDRENELKRRPLGVKKIRWSHYEKSSLNHLPH